MEENYTNETNEIREPTPKDRRKAYDRVMTALASLAATVIIFLLAVLTLTGKDKPYSENENRYLQARPEFSVQSAADGRFMDDMESWLSDQFVGRSVLVKARTYIDIFFGKREINGVYIGKQHYLFEKPSDYGADAVSETVSAMNTFAANHSDVNIYAAIAPNATEVLPNLLPKYAPTQNQTEQIQQIYDSLNGITCVDICSPLKSAENAKELYYKTDHHWTTRGAEIAFKELAMAMAIDMFGVTYSTYPVCRDFQGTMASSSGLFSASDTVNITVPDNEINIVVSCESDGKKSASMFDTTKLEEKNKYEVFFGGNFDTVRIDTDNDTKRVLMVVKDSYANCLIPMLTPYYKTIIMVDPRYFSGSIDRTMKKEAVTDVLWLYNANTFLKDTSIAQVFATE